MYRNLGLQILCAKPRNAKLIKTSQLCYVCDHFSLSFLPYVNKKTGTLQTFRSFVANLIMTEEIESLLFNRRYFVNKDWEK